MFIARAMCGLTPVTVAALCCSCSLLCISNSDWATDKEAGRWRELSLIQFSCDCNSSLVTHNKTPVYSTWGLLRVCVRPARLPVLTWVPSSVPPGTISTIRSWQGPQWIQQESLSTLLYEPQILQSTSVYSANEVDFWFRVIQCNFLWMIFFNPWNHIQYAIWMILC